MSYEIFVTEDGSPSLSFNEGDLNETMHNRRGALSESLYIYHDAIQYTTSRSWTPSFLSVGLGLGYNEMILAAHFLKEAPEKIDTVYIESFEKDTFLFNNLVNWLNEDQQSNEQQAWFNNYDHITALVAAHFKLDKDNLKQTLKDWKDQGHWRLRGKLSTNSKFKSPFSCILFDAFSSKTNPDLWNEDALGFILNSAAADKNVFSTYASTGKLHRALRKAGYLIENRDGFGGKRECTFAIRAK